MARNFMRKMAVGDGVLFYHSSTEPPGVAGLAKVEHTNVIDETQFDPASPYFDDKATREKPQWDCVDVAFVSKLPHYVSLYRMRCDPPLADMVVLRAGRLSVQPVSEAEYQRVVALGDIEPAPGSDKPPKKPKPKKKPKKAKPNPTPKKKKKKARR
jgi:predicted RNA-binding protein with PUA-like domain